MNIRIESQGLSNNTKVFNAETGEVINLVRSVRWECDANDGKAVATIELIFTPGEMTGEAEIICNDLVNTIADYVKNMTELGVVVDRNDISRYIAHSIRSEFIK